MTDINQNREQSNNGSNGKIIILGGGESGVGSAILAKKKGFEVFLSDYGTIDKKYIKLLNEWKIEFEEGKHSKERFADATLCIKSPGIADTLPIILFFKELNIPVISEIEFAYRYSDAKTICITGSNGKTTTATLTYEILKNGGYNVALAGNIGSSYAYQVATQEYDYYVLELSSFQLDGMYDFKADVAIITNVTDDHLDRYNYDFNLYRKSKFRILQNMGRSDCFIYSMDDKNTISYILQQKERFTTYNATFSVKEMLIEGASLNQSGDIEINICGRELIIEREKIALIGIHNVYNIMAAAIAAMRVGVEDKDILNTIYSFEGVEHRMEFIREKGGVRYINDSKATNTDAVFFALQGLKAPVVWIAGGTDKGNDYSTLVDVVKGKVTTLICMGKDNTKLIESFTSIIPFIYSTSSLEEAIKVVDTIGKNGDCVILSPACASFDLFKNYEDRGRKFKEAIRNL